MEKSTEVTIVGGGIAGLFLAISLHQIGIKSRIYEAVTEIQPLGAGINLLPHAVRVKLLAKVLGTNGRNSRYIVAIYK